MNRILLNPRDVLFFRDGRPMTGALAGHSLAWPLPHITANALRAALQRESWPDVHRHRPRRNKHSLAQPADEIKSEERNQTLGSLCHCGPFPVIDDVWYFPRPADAMDPESTALTLRPLAEAVGSSSLPEPLRYNVVADRPPRKDALTRGWWSAEAWQAYLEGGKLNVSNVDDSDIADFESSIGIAIDRESGATGVGDAEGLIYSSHLLRLRPETRLGVLAEAWDKVERDGDSGGRQDLIARWLSQVEATLQVGGQQRLCTVSTAKSSGALPLPVLPEAFFEPDDSGICRVKWVLLTPAIFPRIELSDRRERNDPHPGGWLPNWVDPSSGAVQLLDGPGKGRAQRLRQEPGRPLKARLVAAALQKPVVVTGWSMGNAESARLPGAKSTHLAVPAGSVYYFETDGPEEAARLASALDWYGHDPAGPICRRRSTLMGEKGYGIGICAPWQPRSISNR